MNGSALILSVQLDGESFAVLDEVRRAHFPPARNVLDAHLTLFHHLPGEELDAIVDDLMAITGETAPIAMVASGPRSLGRGTAIAIEAPALERLRGELAARWRPWLTPQDRQPLRPHVTVQNKVSAEEARELLAELRGCFVPMPVTAEGLLLWRYLGGPWEFVELFPFTGEPTANAVP